MFRRGGAAHRLKHRGPARTTTPRFRSSREVGAVLVSTVFLYFRVTRFAAASGRVMTPSRKCDAVDFIMVY